MDVVANLATAIDRPAAASAWRAEARDLLTRLLRELWDGTTWRVLTPGHAAPAPAPGADSLLPYVALVLGELLPR